MSAATPVASAANVAGLDPSLIAGVPVEFSPPAEEEMVNPTDIYTFIRRLGAGTYGQVYHATDKRTQRDVAIKILPLSRQNEAEIVTYEREVSVLQAGSTSPYVVNLIETYMFDSEVWIVMEYCGAGALESILIDSAGRPQPLSEDEAAAVIKMLLLGLLHLHQRRKIHRDVKGANVLVTARGECKLADFGLSALLDTTMGNANSLCGTPFYVAPEVCKRRPYNAKCDIWSLGVLTYVLLVGHVPYQLRHMKPLEVLRAIPTASPDLWYLPGMPDGHSRFTPSMEAFWRDSVHVPPRRGWSPAVSDFLACCFHHNPEKRWRADELLTHVWITRVPRLRFADVPARDASGVVTVKRMLTVMPTEPCPPDVGGSYPTSSGTRPGPQVCGWAMFQDDHGMGARATIERHVRRIIANITAGLQTKNFTETGRDRIVKKPRGEVLEFKRGSTAVPPTAERIAMAVMLEERERASVAEQTRRALEESAAALSAKEAEAKSKEDAAEGVAAVASALHHGYKHAHTATSVSGSGGAAAVYSAIATAVGNVQVHSDAANTAHSVVTVDSHVTSENAHDNAAHNHYAHGQRRGRSRRDQQQQQLEQQQQQQLQQDRNRSPSSASAAATAERAAIAAASAAVYTNTIAVANAELQETIARGRALAADRAQQREMAFAAERDRLRDAAQTEARAFERGVTEATAAGAAAALAVGVPTTALLSAMSTDLAQYAANGVAGATQTMLVRRVGGVGSDDTGDYFPNRAWLNGACRSVDFVNLLVRDVRRATEDAHRFERAKAYWDREYIAAGSTSAAATAAAVQAATGVIEGTCHPDDALAAATVAADVALREQVWETSRALAITAVSFATALAQYARAVLRLSATMSHEAVCQLQSLELYTAHNNLLVAEIQLQVRGTSATLAAAAFDGIGPDEVTSWLANSGLLLHGRWAKPYVPGLQRGCDDRTENYLRRCMHVDRYRASLAETQQQRDAALRELATEVKRQERALMHATNGTGDASSSPEAAARAQAYANAQANLLLLQGQADAFAYARETCQGAGGRTVQLFASAGFTGDAHAQSSSNAATATTAANTYSNASGGNYSFSAAAANMAAAEAAVAAAAAQAASNGCLSSVIMMGADIGPPVCGSSINRSGSQSVHSSGSSGREQQRSSRGSSSRGSSTGSGGRGQVATSGGSSGGGSDSQQSWHAPVPNQAPAEFIVPHKRLIKIAQDEDDHEEFTAAAEAAAAAASNAIAQRQAEEQQQQEQQMLELQLQQQQIKLYKQHQKLQTQQQRIDEQMQRYARETDQHANAQTEAFFTVPAVASCANDGSANSSNTDTHTKNGGLGSLAVTAATAAPVAIVASYAHGRTHGHGQINTGSHGSRAAAAAALSNGNAARANTVTAMSDEPDAAALAAAVVGADASTVSTVHMSTTHPSQGRPRAATITVSVAATAAVNKVHHQQQLQQQQHQHMAMGNDSSSGVSEFVSCSGFSSTNSSGSAAGTDAVHGHSTHGHSTGDETAEPTTLGDLDSSNGDIINGHDVNTMNNPECHISAVRRSGRARGNSAAGANGNTGGYTSGNDSDTTSPQSPAMVPVSLLKNNVSQQQHQLQQQKSSGSGSGEGGSSLMCDLTFGSLDMSMQRA